MVWEPLFRSSEPEYAWAMRVIAQGSDALSAIKVTSESSETIPKHEPFSNDPTLAFGDAGLAILFAELQRASGVDYTPEIVRLLKRAAENAVTLREIGLYWGSTGVAWALSNLHELVKPFTDGEDPNSDFDAELLNRLRFPNKRQVGAGHDLCYGLSGIAVYALTRLQHEHARSCFDTVLSTLESTAETNRHGLVWRSRILEAIPGDKRFPGVAHGTPGVIGMLSLAYSIGQRGNNIARLLSGAVERVLHERLETRGSQNGIMTWCWGDPGIAAVTLLAARCTRESTWERRAITLAHRCALEIQRVRLPDASLCHGTAGLAHIYNRLYQSTQDPVFGQAARYMIRETLRRQQEGKGIAGYQFLADGIDNGSVTEPTPGVLQGLAGVILALVAATVPLEPSWDQFMLLSIPPTNGASAQ